MPEVMLKINVFSTEKFSIIYSRKGFFVILSAVFVNDLSMKESFIYLHPTERANCGNK